MLQRFGVTAGASGSASGDRPTGQVPGFSADLVELYGSPFLDVERVGAADRYRAAVLHHGGDPVRPVSGDMGDQLRPVGSQPVEEALQSGLVLPGRGPHQPARIVVDHDRQVLVATLV